MLKVLKINKSKRNLVKNIVKRIVLPRKRGLSPKSDSDDEYDLVPSNLSQTVKIYNQRMTLATESV